jgi:hypothetical protein
MALGSTQPLTEMSTTVISWGYRRPLRKADNLTTFICRQSWNSGSFNPLEPSGRDQACMKDWFTFTFTFIFQGKSGIASQNRPRPPLYSFSISPHPMMLLILFSTNNIYSFLSIKSHPHIAAPSLSAHDSLNRNSLLYGVPNYPNARYRATNCVEPTMPLCLSFTSVTTNEHTTSVLFFFSNLYMFV